jgi:hypothetical protein
MYAAPAWMPGGHLQTIWPAVISPTPRVRLHRKRWTTPDDDFIDIDWLEASVEPAASAAPWVLMFHGLEGSSQSTYCRSLAAQARQQGWNVAIAHFRTCSGPINLRPRTYHSGDSAEIDWIVRRFKQEFAPTVPIYAAGVSLGGNALMKWAGEQGEAARPLVQATAAVCPPQDLEAGAIALAKPGLARLYMWNFFKTLKPKCEQKWQQYPGSFDRLGAQRAKTFADFDEAATAPLHGFKSARDYWTQSSCRQFLRSIAVPTLVINALNDPFVPAHGLATKHEVSSHVLLEYPSQGGHVGFAQGLPPGQTQWLARRLLDFFAQQKRSAHG